MISESAAVQPLHKDAQPVDLSTSDTQILGYCHPQFAAVASAFAANFSADELGASFALQQGGERVVDLWGGWHEPERHTRWEEDSVAVMFSCSKMAAAMVIHRLVESGALSLDEPLTTVWPELTAGTAGGTLRMALSHTLGLPALSTRLRSGAYWDHAYMAQQLAQQPPLWAPGTQLGYHPITFGYILGELVQRVTGQSLGHCFQLWFAQPLGLDMWIGLPEAAYSRVAPIQPYRPQKGDPVSRVARASRQIGSVPNLWMFNAGGWTVDAVNPQEGLTPEMPAVNGVGNGRGLAALLSVFNCASVAEGVGLSEVTTARVSSVSAATHQDATLCTRTRFSMGFMKSMDNRDDPAADNFIIGESAFGHVGHGGAFGFCDPEAGVSAGYVMNQQGPGILVNQRGQGLIDACYQALGYRDVIGGAWRR